MISANNRMHLKKNQSQHRQSSIFEKKQKSIVEILQSKITIICDLCNHQVIQPKICPSCNQIFCEPCLFKYHQEYKNCPMCHQKYNLEDFLDCQCNNYLDYFRKQLQQIKSYDQDDPRHFQAFLRLKMQTQKQDNDMCSQHSIPLKYFCQNCSKPICSDCGMMSLQHRNHKFSRLNDIYARIKQKLNNQLGRLTNRIFESQEYSLKIKKKLQKLQLQHMHIKRYTEEYYILLFEKFQEETATKMICLKEIQDKNSKEIEFYESVRDSICEDIQKKSKNQLINQVDKLISSFTMVTCDPPEHIKFEQCFDTIKQLLPEYHNFSYCLLNFSLSNGGIVYSQSFVLIDVEWRLKIYPKGNGVAKGKYLSVFVEMTKASSNQKKFQYKIQLANKDIVTQSIRRQYCSTFDIGECWGYNQFILLQELQNGFLNQDKLNFVMGIRNPDYRSLSEDQAAYIAKIQNKIKIKDLQQENYIQQTNIIDDLQKQSYSSKNNSLNNQTKFLKFLENSTSFEERAIQKRQKEREMQKGEKDQQYISIDLLNQFAQEQKQKKQETPKNKLNFKNFKDEFELKIEQKQSKKNIIRKDRIKDEFQQNEYKQQYKNIKNSYTNENSDKVLFKHKQQTHQHRQQVKTKQKYNYQPKLKPVKKKQENQIQRLAQQFTKQEKNEEKYSFYFSSLRKNSNQIKNQNKSVKSQIKQSQPSKNYHNYHNIKKTAQNNQILSSFGQEYKLQLFENNYLTFEQEKGISSKVQQKRQQKKQNLNKKIVKKSHSHFKNKIEQQEDRQKQIQTILQQSKKLEGIKNDKGTSGQKLNIGNQKQSNKNMNLSSKLSVIKQSGLNPSTLIKSPLKNSSQIKQDNQKQQDKEPYSKRQQSWKNDRK